MRILKNNKDGSNLARVMVANEIHITVTDDGGIWRDITQRCLTTGHWLSGKFNFYEIYIKEYPKVDSRIVTKLLAPTDLQPIKAFRIIFIASLLERLVEDLSVGEKI